MSNSVSALSSSSKKQDAQVRKVVTEASPDVTFEDGADTLLRLGCFLFLEKVAKEAHELGRIEEAKKVTGPVATRACKSAMSDVRQFS